MPTTDNDEPEMAICATTRAPGAITYAKSCVAEYDSTAPSSSAPGSDRFRFRYTVVASVDVSTPTCDNDDEPALTVKYVPVALLYIAQHGAALFAGSRKLPNDAAVGDEPFTVFTVNTSKPALMGSVASTIKLPLASFGPNTNPNGLFEPSGENTCGVAASTPPEIGYTNTPSVARRTVTNSRLPSGENEICDSDAVMFGSTPVTLTPVGVSASQQQQQQQPHTDTNTNRYGDKPAGGRAGRQPDARQPHKQREARPHLLIGSTMATQPIHRPQRT